MAQPEPLVLAFLSGGTYTENQTDLSEVAALGIPAVLYYPPAETDWNVQAAAGAPGNWVFHEVDAGGHGTAMLERDASVGTQVIATFANVLDAGAS